MFQDAVTRTKRWLGRHLLRQSPVEQWSLLELERRIRKLELQKQEYKDEMDEAKRGYDNKIREARTADETEIPAIKSEASQLLNKYEAIRSQWFETLIGLRFLQQAALGKQMSANGPEALPSNMDPAQFERSADAISQKVRDREDRILTWGTAAKHIEDSSQGSSVHIHSTMADARVDAAIEAAREGEDVPTLDELADEAFADIEPEPMAEHQPEPERF